MGPCVNRSLCDWDLFVLGCNVMGPFVIGSLAMGPCVGVPLALLIVHKAPT
jgi:hypothetical protein